jgi:hypothetical protein
VPGEILCFLDIDEPLMNLFNLTSLAPIENPGKYAMMYSLEEEIPGLMDPTITHLDQEHVMQMNSILFFYGEKETNDNEDLVIRLVHVDSFVRPLIVVPDFDPTFSNKKQGINIDHWVRTEERNNSYIVVRPRDLWHLTFLELAKEHYGARNKKNKSHR